MDLAMTDFPLAPADLAIVELVDSDIRIRPVAGKDSDRTTTIGLALLTPAGVITGEPARQRAWLEPQRSYSQFWHQLNLAPLPGNSRNARHHADLAFAQLTAIHQAAGQPGQMLFAVPGSFSREQLAILLGLANALPFRTAGLVDSAVAAACLQTSAGTVLHVDLPLHQSLITRLEIGDRVQRTSVIPVAGTGLRHFHESWSRHIANRFIAEYRYDPLHTAESEQQLQDRLTGWLAQMATAPEITVDLTSARGNYQLRLQRDELLAATAAQTERLQQALKQQDSARTILLSHRLAALPAMTALLAGVALPASACLDGCLARLDEICLGTQPIAHVTRLRAASRATTTGSQAAPAAPPTHLLHGHQAWPLRQGLNLGLADGQPQLSRDLPLAAALAVNAGTVCLISGDPAISADRPDDLRAGDRIRCGATELLLIREQGSGGQEQM